MKKLIIITLFAALSSQYVSAQAEHEFSVYASGGLSSLMYSPVKGSSNPGAGGEFGVGYTFFSGKFQALETGKVVQAKWGIHSGVGLGLYGAKANVDKETIVQENIPDSDNGDLFDLHTTLTGYRETQQAMLLNVPVMALYDLKSCYFMAGLKFGIPLAGKFKPKEAIFFNEAEYKQYENSLKDQEFAGLGTFRRKSPDGAVDLGVTIMLSLEAGYKWRINDQLSLYAGVYFDYGLNNSLKNNPMPFVNYNYTVENPTGGFTTNSVLSSFADKTNIMSAGVKIRLAMGL